MSERRRIGRSADITERSPQPPSYEKATVGRTRVEKRQPITRKHTSQKSQQERLQEYVDTLLQKQSNKVVQYSSTAVSSSSTRSESLQPRTALEKMTRKHEKEYERRLRWMTTAGNLEWELKNAKSAFEEQEQAIRDQDAEAEQQEGEIARLDKKLNDEQKAANLGWKLLWNQKKHIDEVEKYIATSAHLELSKSDGTKTTGTVEKEALFRTVNDAAHENVLKSRNHQISKLGMELAGAKQQITDAHSSATKLVEENALLRVLNDGAAAEAKKLRDRNDSLEISLGREADRAKDIEDKAAAEKEEYLLEIAKLKAALAKKGTLIKRAFRD